MLSEVQIVIDIDSLSWYLPIEKQRANIDNVKYISDDDVERLILPHYKQTCWENCAVLLSTLDDQRFISFLPKILEWYKDLNWPGIEVIGKRIREIPPYLVKDAVTVALRNAKNENDEEWYENLANSFSNILSL